MTMIGAVAQPSIKIHLSKTIHPMRIKPMLFALHLNVFSGSDNIVNDKLGQTTNKQLEGNAGWGSGSENRQLPSSWLGKLFFAQFH